MKKAEYLTPVVTIFDRVGNIDQRGNEMVYDFLIKGGVDGIVVMGSTGEFFAMSMEQKKRLIDRIVTKQKNWKFSMADINERKYWDRYHKIYGEVLGATSTKYAPWYIVPADDKWYTRYVVAQIVLDTLRYIKPSFPKLAPEVEEQLKQFRALLKEVDLDDLKTIEQAIDKK